MRIGEGTSQKSAPQKSQSASPKKSAGGDADSGKATSIGELIKQKLGEKLMGADKPEKASKKKKAKAEDADVAAVDETNETDET